MKRYQGDAEEARSWATPPLSATRLSRYKSMEMRPRALISSRYDLAYVPVPKCATTSLKRLWYDIEHDGEEYRPRRHGPRRQQHRHIHDYFRREAEPLPLHDAKLFKFAVVRDPVSRFLSAYRNRVRHHRELSTEHLQASRHPAASDLPPDPDLATFVDLLEDYRAASRAIHQHTEPMVSFLGTDPTRFDALYDVSECDLLARDLTKRIGRDVTLGRFQQGGPTVSPLDLGARRLRKIIAFYFLDYVVFLPRYRPPTSCILPRSYTP